MTAVLALIAANIIWGAAPPIFKLAFQTVPPFILGFLRFYIAFLFFIPFVKNRELGPINASNALLLVAGSLAFVFNIVFFFMGLKYAPSINVAVIGTAAPLFLYYFSVFVLKEKPRPQLLTGMIIGTIGVLVIILSPFMAGGGKLALGEMYGNVLFVLSAVMQLAHMVIFKQVLKNMSVTIVSAFSLFIASLFFLPVAMIQAHTWDYAHIAPSGIWGILFGAFLCTALAYHLFYWGIKRIPAEEMGLYAYIDPVVTVLVAAPLLHEYPDQYFFIGSFLVLMGVFWAERRIAWHPVHKLKKGR
ncbi:DMT family transporter [Candidatus Microgenomates bacterium]|nr:DMT family transporter [Candidatus Microgenomates bacterium]